MKRTTSIILAIIIALLIFIVIFFIGKNEEKNTPVTDETISMGTVISLAVYGDSEENAKQTISEIEKIISKLDANNLSWRIKNSDVYKINENDIQEVSEITSNCIKTCLEISQKTDGLFDVTVGDLTTLWGIGTEDAKVPSETEIKDTISKVDYKKVSVDGNTVTIGEGQKLDLGAVGKGLACDESFKYISSTEIKGAIISVGGSLLVYGQNPGSEDGTWNIGVRDPFGSTNDSAGTIQLRNTSEKSAFYVSTSGDYEKTLTVDGKTYHHILNPKTGYPAESNVTGVTIISNSGTLSDALSTACFSLGYSNESLTLLKAYNSEAIFILKDKTVYVTEGLRDSFTLTNEDLTLSK